MSVCGILTVIPGGGGGEMRNQRNEIHEKNILSANIGRKERINGRKIKQTKVHSQTEK